MRPVNPFGAVAFLAVAISSAQGERPVPVIAGVPNACALLSRRTMEVTSGVPVAEGAPGLNSQSLASCSFAGQHGGEAMILVRWAPTGDWVTEQIARMKRGVGFGTYREVPGIGEQSFLYTIRASGAVLCVFGSGYYLQVSLYRIVENSQITTALAKLANLSIQTLADSGACSARGRSAKMKKRQWSERHHMNGGS